MSGRKTADDPSLNCACKRECESGARDGQAGVEWSELGERSTVAHTDKQERQFQPASSKNALGCGRA